MINFFYGLDPLTQAIIASSLTFLMTVFGSSFVFLFKKVNKNIMDALLGISAGIMLAAAIFSLLLPSIEQANTLNMNTIVVVSIGILLGGLLLIIGDKISNKYLLRKDDKPKNSFLLIVLVSLEKPSIKISWLLYIFK